MDAVASRVTEEEGPTWFLHLSPAVLALIFIARRIQPSLSDVAVEVDTLVPVLTCRAFYFYFLRKKRNSWLHRDSNSRPNVRRFRGYELNHRGDRHACAVCLIITYSRVEINPV